MLNNRCFTAIELVEFYTKIAEGTHYNMHYMNKPCSWGPCLSSTLDSWSLEPAVFTAESAYDFFREAEGTNQHVMAVSPLSGGFFITGLYPKEGDTCSKWKLEPKNMTIKFDIVTLIEFLEDFKASASQGCERWSNLKEVWEFVPRIPTIDCYLNRWRVKP
jgi:hypothetical protein